VDARTIRIVAPALYAIVIVVLALTARGTALAIAAVVGAMLVGLAYRLSVPEGEGRNRQRNRRRG